MKADQLVESELPGEIGVPGEKGAPVPNIQHKSHASRPGIELGPPRW